VSRQARVHQLVAGVDDLEVRRERDAGLDPVLDEAGHDRQRDWLWTREKVRLREDQHIQDNALHGKFLAYLFVMCR